MRTSPEREDQRLRTRVRDVRPAQAAPSPVGSLAGATAAVGSYRATVSPWLAGFSFVMVFYTIGHALPRTLGRPHKAPRLALFALLPAASCAIFGIVAVAGEPRWLAVILAFVGGSAR